MAQYGNATSLGHVGLLGLEWLGEKRSCCLCSLPSLGGYSDTPSIRVTDAYMAWGAGTQAWHNMGTPEGLNT